MTRDEQKSLKESPVHSQEVALSVRDLIRYLSRLANLQSDVQTGNLLLSKGLQQLVKGLRPHASRSIPDLVEILREGYPSNRRKSSSKRTRAILPSCLDSISRADIENVLSNSRYNKKQLIELGVVRFGIPKSKLTGLKRTDVIESIHAALDHETSLDVISEEAQRRGTERLS